MSASDSLTVTIGVRIESDAIFTVAQACKAVSVHPETLRRKLRQGIIKGKRILGDWRIKGSELLKLA